MKRPERHFYVTDFGEVQLPDEPPLGVMWHGSPNRYFANGIYARYLRYIEGLAKHAWERRGRLKIAPPLSAFYKWERANG